MLADARVAPVGSERLPSAEWLRYSGPHGVPRSPGNVIALQPAMEQRLDAAPASARSAQNESRRIGVRENAIIASHNSSSATAVAPSAGLRR